jgi:bifunctional DNase/RNase
VLVEVKVQSLGLDRASNTPVVILQEAGGDRVLPIWIGPGEASAIAMHLASMAFGRPLTHDLLVSVVGGLGGSLQRVIITRVVNNTYYAELIMARDGQIVSVDARPSDSIAVALRMEAPIYASEELLEQAAIEVAEDEATEEWQTSAEAEEAAAMDAEQLKEYLRKLNPEDFGRFTP